MAATSPEDKRSVHACACSPHLLPSRTGQAACLVRRSPSPLGNRLYQNTADPCWQTQILHCPAGALDQYFYRQAIGTRTFWGHTDTPMSVKTVAPPACTSLICSMKEETVSQTSAARSYAQSRGTDVEQPGGDPVPRPQLLEGVRLVLLRHAAQTGSRPTGRKQTACQRSQR